VLIEALQIAKASAERREAEATTRLSKEEA